MDSFISGLVKNHQPQKLAEINKSKNKNSKQSSSITNPNHQNTNQNNQNNQNNQYSQNNQTKHNHKKLSSKIQSQKSNNQQSNSSKRQQQQNKLQLQINQHNQNQYQKQEKVFIRDEKYKQHDEILSKDEKHVQQQQLPQRKQSIEVQQVEEVIDFQNMINNQDIHQNQKFQNVQNQHQNTSNKSPFLESQNFSNPFTKLNNTSSQPELSYKNKKRSTNSIKNQNIQIQYASSQKHSDKDHDSINKYLPSNSNIKSFKNHIQNAQILQSKQYDGSLQFNHFDQNEQKQYQNNRRCQQQHKYKYISSVNSNSPMILSNTKNQISFPFPQAKKNFYDSLVQIKLSLIDLRSQHKQFYQNFKNQRLQFEESLILAQDQILNQIRLYIQKKLFKNTVPQKIINNNQPLTEVNKKNIQLQQLLIKKQRQFSLQRQLIQQQYQQKILYLKEKNQILQQQISQLKNINTQQHFNENNFQQTQNDFNKNVIIQLRQKIQEMAMEIHQKDLQIQELQKDNENLSQHVFDIEQQIAGIQLEVQKKLQQELFKLKKSGAITINFNVHENHTDFQQHRLNTISQQSQLEQSANMLTMNNYNSNSQANLINSYSNSYQKHDTHKLQIQQISKQLESYIKKCQFLELQKKNKESHYQERQRIIKIKESQIQKNQEDLNYEWAELDKQIHRNKMRQNELQLAEENISKKISQLRLKETQFGQKQRQFEGKVRQFQKQKIQIEKSLNLRQEELEKRNSFNIDQINMNNLNSRKQQIGVPELDLPIRGSKNQPQRDYQVRYSNIDIDGNSLSMKYRPDKLYQNPYHKSSNSNFVRDPNYQSDKFYRQRQRVSYETGSNYRVRKNVGNQYTLLQSPNKRSRSKSRSHEKNIKHLYGSHLQGQNQTISNYKMVGNYKQQIRETPSYNISKGGNISGLGSKLQRLRDQIKKQIDSIK